MELNRNAICHVGTILDILKSADGQHHVEHYRSGIRAEKAIVSTALPPCRQQLTCCARSRLFSEGPGLDILAASKFHRRVDPEQSCCSGLDRAIATCFRRCTTSQVATRLAIFRLLLRGEKDKTPPDSGLHLHGPGYRSRAHEVDPAPVPARLKRRNSVARKSAL